MGSSSVPQVAARLFPVLLALAATLVIFGLFLSSAGVDALQAYGLIWRGAFGTWFSWQNTLVNASPLLLTGLCTALPAQIGLLVIGGEGAFVIGGLAAVATGLALSSAGLSPVLIQFAMAAVGAAAGGGVIALSGLLRIRRGVNETISSLLIAYISIAVMEQIVEGPMRDPASLNRPATQSLAPDVMLGTIPGSTIHIGLFFGLMACIAGTIWIYRTRQGFAARIIGGNIRAGRLVGLPVERLILGFCFVGGCAAGLGGMIEVAAVQGSVSSDLATGVGYAGVLAAFLARQNPLALIPVAVLLGGVDAAGGLLQQQLGTPNSTTLVLRGILFVMLLASEAMFGGLPFLKRQHHPAKPGSSEGGVKGVA